MVFGQVLAGPVFVRLPTDYDDPAIKNAAWQKLALRPFSDNAQMIELWPLFQIQ